MRNILLFQFTLVICFAGASFNKHSDIHVANQIEADRKAEFPEGIEKMNSWIKENLRTPTENVRYGIVRVEFTVKKNGKLSNFVIKKGLNENMDFAAIECLQGMPSWVPAIQSGKKISQNVTLPITFSSKD